MLGWESIWRLILAAVLGGVIGAEREELRKPAGLRTHMLVSMGSCIFTLVSLLFSTDPARIAASIVTGVGFIGAGCIIATRNRVIGVSTAASLWVTAGIGMLVGIGEEFLAIITALITLLILHVGIYLKRTLRRK